MNISSLNNKNLDNKPIQTQSQKNDNSVGSIFLSFNDDNGIVEKSDIIFANEETKKIATPLFTFLDKYCDGKQKWTSALSDTVKMFINHFNESLANYDKDSNVENSEQGVIVTDKNGKIKFSAFLNNDNKSSTPKQSSAQTQQSPQPKPQETQRLESTNSAQISPEPSESIKSDTANTPSDENQTSEKSLNVGENSTQSEPSDESVNSNENSSENVAQNSAQDDTPSESVNLMSSQNTKPSFDCAKASTNAEKIVCSDDELARLDNELANAYKNALNSLDNASKKQLTNEQKSWLKTYNQCTDKECVKYHLQMRIWAL